MSKEEKVLAIKEHRLIKALKEDGYRDGTRFIYPITEDELDKLIKGKCFTDTRENLEEVNKDNPSKHFITYCLLRKGGTDEYFIYQRGKKVGEQRLSGKLSIGIGGHVNPNSTNTKKLNGDQLSIELSSIYDSLTRELLEETNLEEINPDIHIEDKVDYPLTLILDSTNDVGKVHIGVGMIITVEPEVCDQIKVNEEEGLLTIGFRHIRHILEEPELIGNMENWSQMMTMGIAKGAIQ